MMKEPTPVKKLRCDVCDQTTMLPAWCVDAIANNGNGPLICERCLRLEAIPVDEALRLIASEISSGWISREATEEIAAAARKILYGDESPF